MKMSSRARVPRGVQGGRPGPVLVQPERELMIVGLWLFRVIRPAPSGGRARDVAHQPRRAGVESRGGHRPRHERLARARHPRSRSAVRTPRRAL